MSGKKELVTCLVGRLKPFLLKNYVFIYIVLDFVVSLVTGISNTTRKWIVIPRSRSDSACFNRNFRT